MEWIFLLIVLLLDVVTIIHVVRHHHHDKNALSLWIELVVLLPILGAILYGLLDAKPHPRVF